MKNKGNILLPLITAVAIIAVMAASYFFWQNQSNNTKLTDKPPISNPNKPQPLIPGIHGKVTLTSGNCTPGTSIDPSCKSQPVSRIIYIRLPKLIHSSEKPKLVSQTKSDADGYYSIYLSSGTYSVFVEDNGVEYCNSFSDQGDCLVNISNTSVEYNININKAAW